MGMGFEPSSSTVRDGGKYTLPSKENTIYPLPLERAMGCSRRGSVSRIGQSLAVASSSPPLLKVHRGPQPYHCLRTNRNCKTDQIAHIVSDIISASKSEISPSLHKDEWCIIACGPRLRLHTVNSTYRIGLETGGSINRDSCGLAHPASISPAAHLLI